ncbi:MAG TPA: putative zinc-binding protein, partial [Phycisphaerae bacterium]|nr:putative zinc-binding protein [Phycisphaerae bacterium]
MGNDDHREKDESERIVLLYACSGGSNAAEAADRAVREATSEGLGMMFCLAGIGAGIGAGPAGTASPV